MRTDYPICPKCSKGRLVPLMFGPGKCDMSCEDVPATAPVRVGSTDWQPWSKPFVNPFAVPQKYLPTISLSGHIYTQQAPGRNMRYVFEPRDPSKLRGRNLKGQRATVSVGIERATMNIITSGSALVVLDPSDDAKLLWDPAGARAATLEV